MDKLTKKQQGFVKDYIETDNATQAALNNYDVKDGKVSKERVAEAIGSENLSKPIIQEVIKSIGERITDDELLLKHKEFLNSYREEIGIKALDMGYKLKGSYAPEKNLNLDINVDITNPKAVELAQEYEERLKRNL